MSQVAVLKSVMLFFGALKILKKNLLASNLNNCLMELL